MRRRRIGEYVQVSGRGPWGSPGYLVEGRVVRVDGMRFLLAWDDSSVSRRVWFHGSGRPVLATHRDEGLAALLDQHKDQK